MTTNIRLPSNRLNSHDSSALPTSHHLHFSPYPGYSEYSKYSPTPITHGQKFTLQKDFYENIDSRDIEENRKSPISEISFMNTIPYTSLDFQDRGNQGGDLCALRSTSVGEDLMTPCLHLVSPVGQLTANPFLRPRVASTAHTVESQHISPRQVEEQMDEELRESQHQNTCNLHFNLSSHSSVLRDGMQTNCWNDDVAPTLPYLDQRYTLKDFKKKRCFVVPTLPSLHCSN